MKTESALVQHTVAQTGLCGLPGPNVHPVVVRVRELEAELVLGQVSALEKPCRRRYALPARALFGPCGQRGVPAPSVVAAVGQRPAQGSAQMEINRATTLVVRASVQKLQLAQLHYAHIGHHGAHGLLAAPAVDVDLRPEQGDA